MEYQVERFEAFLEAMPDRREEQQRYFAKAEVRLAREWDDPRRSANRCCSCLAARRDDTAAAEAALHALRRRQVEEYLAHLDRAGFIRSRLHSGLAAYLEDPEAATA